jgi:hypothetical protein
MSKANNTPEIDALEIIELATADLNTLARAFDLIQEVCAEFEQPGVSLSDQHGPLVQ